jgi:hypothetical protein
MSEAGLSLETATRRGVEGGRCVCAEGGCCVKTEEMRECMCPRLVVRVLARWGLMGIFMEEVLSSLG